MYKRILGASLVAQMVKSAWDAGDPSLIPGSGRSPGEGNGNALQRSHLENSMDRGAWELQPMGVTQISAAKHIKFIIFSCKCAMCQAILPGGSPPLMTQRSGSCFFDLSTNSLHGFHSGWDEKDWTIVGGLLFAFSWEEHIHSCSLAIISHMTLPYCKETGKHWLWYVRKKKWPFTKALLMFHSQRKAWCVFTLKMWGMIRRAVVGWGHVSSKSPEFPGIPLSLCSRAGPRLKGDWSRKKRDWKMEAGFTRQIF